MKRKIIACALGIVLLLPNATSATHRKKAHTNPDHTFAEKPENKRDRTILGTTLGFGSIGAITAGVASKGYWAPVGLVGGALVGWAIGKAIKHSKNKKNIQIIT